MSVDYEIINTSLKGMSLSEDDFVVVAHAVQNTSDDDVMSIPEAEEYFGYNPSSYSDMVDNGGDAYVERVAREIKEVFSAILQTRYDAIMVPSGMNLDCHLSKFGMVFGTLHNHTPKFCTVDRAREMGFPVTEFSGKGRSAYCMTRFNDKHVKFCHVQECMPKDVVHKWLDAQFDKDKTLCVQYIDVHIYVNNMDRSMTSNIYIYYTEKDE